MGGTPDTAAVRGFWDWAFKQSPKAARFLFVGFLVLAVAAIVMAWQVSIGSLAVTALLGKRSINRALASMAGS
jgi:hypothetical protein